MTARIQSFLRSQDSSSLGQGPINYRDWANFLLKIWSSSLLPFLPMIMEIKLMTILLIEVTLAIISHEALANGFLSRPNSQEAASSNNHRNTNAVKSIRVNSSCPLLIHHFGPVIWLFMRKSSVLVWEKASSILNYMLMPINIIPHSFTLGIPEKEKRPSPII